MSDKQLNLPIELNKYRVWVTETISGCIDIEAEDQDEARDKVQELADEYGLDELFYPNSNACRKDLQSDMEEAKIVYSKHTHGDREVLDLEEMKQ